MDSSEGAGKPDVLYHYTSLQGLVGILRTGRLRASYVGLLNDRKEVELGLDLIESTLLGDPHGDALLGDLGKNREYDRVFITCFAEARDSLPLWRGYAATPGGGYAIGFRREALEHAIVERSDPPDSRKPTLRQVQYDPEKFKTEISELAMRVAAQLDDDETAVDPAWDPAGLFVRAATLKQSPWSGEQEWRLVVIHDSFDGMDSIRELDVRESLYGPIPFVDLRLWTAPREKATWEFHEYRDRGDLAEVCIESVWIGPESGQLDRGKGVEILLRQAGVQPSKACLSARAPGRDLGEASLIWFSEWATR